MVNVERLKTLREFLVKHEDRFDYGTFCSDKGLNTFGEMLRPECNTLACVGGWAIALFDPDAEANRDSWYSFIAAECLGLNDAQTDFLFYGAPKFGFPSISIDHAPLRNALDRIDYLIKEAEDDLSKVQGATGQSEHVVLPTVQADHGPTSP